MEDNGQSPEIKEGCLKHIITRYLRDINTVEACINTNICSNPIIDFNICTEIHYISCQVHALMHVCCCVLVNLLMDG